MKKIIVLLVIILFPARVLVSAPFTAAKPEALEVKIVGDPRSGLTLYGVYFFSDTDGHAEGVSTYQWYYSNYSDGSDSAAIPGATSESFKLTVNQLGKYIGFSVRPADEYGNQSDSTYFSTTWVGPVFNDPPVAKIGAIASSGGFNVNDVLTGHYEYTDAEGDVEDGSVYEWWRSPSSNFFFAQQILSASGISYKLSLDDTGKYLFFRVIPVAKSGSISGNQVTSTGVGPVNTPPYVSPSSVKISGTAAVDSTLTGEYVYHDGDGDDEGNTIFRWLRDGSFPIPGADSKIYVLTSEDAGSRIKFEVTPVSGTGYPDTGDPVLSDYTSYVTDMSGVLPAATDLCISGTRAVGEELTGKYHYIDKYKEKNSEYYWYRDAIILKSGTSAGSLKYILTADDIDHEIKFAVVPRNKNGQTGTKAFSAPLAFFTLPRETFSIADPDIPLTASPASGIFWGEGVTSGSFSPSSVDYTRSPFTVYYQVYIENVNTTCLQKTSTELAVTGMTIYFDSFRDVYCQNGGFDTIYVRNVPPGSNSIKFHLTDPDAIVGFPDDTTIIIDPGRMRAGSRLDTLFFQAVDSLSLLKIFRTFQTDSITTVSILNLPPESDYCDNLAPFELLVSHPGGRFEGPVADRFFDPSLTVGDTAVRYTYTTNRGCISSVRVPVTINPSPDISFGLEDVCIESNSDTTNFINATVSPDIVKKWLWEFYEGGDTIPSTRKNPGYLYTAGALHRVILTATTVNNCVAELDTVVELGFKPVADFYWKNECFHPLDSLWLFDATSSKSLIKSQSWNFFDGDSLRTVRNPKYPKKATGYLTVEYIVKTNYHRCHDTVRKQIFIRPTISLAADDYLEDFENGSGGWIKDEAVRNSWLFGRPDRININSAASGGNAWFTGYSITDQKVESSSVISPCFDFTLIKRPMISLMLWKRFDRNRDGAALQYMTGDSGQWQHVGTLDDGLNWYNSTIIKGKPGGDQIGWTSGNQQDKTWGEARHRLDELVGKKDVKFRIAYGSDGTSQDNDGIAFDDIWIGPRTRGVLLEHFANNSSPASSSATAMVSDLANRDTADIINIQYHTNFPGSDPYYNDNPGDASARFLFYGLAKSPYSFIDGGTRKNYAGIFDYLVADIDSNDLAKRSLINPSFAIELNTVVTGGILAVSGKIKALEKINSENVTLYLAVTEKKNSAHTGALGETEFYNVFRKFIPDAGGISLARDWNKDEEYSFAERTWIIEKIPNTADIEIIAFIQNNITKEVYQAESNVKHKIIVGIENLNAANDKSFAFYPNPAVNRLTVAFKQATEAETDILIYDFSGSLVRAFKTGAGTTEYNIDNLGLKSGIYLVKVVTNGLNKGYRKLVISKN
jgi:hypothetical protein